MMACLTSSGRVVLACTCSTSRVGSAPESTFCAMTASDSATRVCEIAVFWPVSGGGSSLPGRDQGQMVTSGFFLLWPLSSEIVLALDEIDCGSD